MPTFPGESTNTPSKPAEGEAGGVDLGPRDEAGADSGTQRQATAPGAHAEDEAAQLLTLEDEEGFRLRWQEEQNRFLDDLRGAVHTADALAADVMQKLLPEDTGECT
ncbi:hypothetical protein ACFTY8_42635 [Streptomyces mirabilis]|uniref:hypothetical protein n=1 Tax=Streptomyces mirabilis TaxID=68239 RepID=UPI00363DF920